MTTHYSGRRNASRTAAFAILLFLLALAPSPANLDLDVERTAGSIRARGMGNPWISFNDGEVVPVSGALDGAEPLGFTSGDFNGDGIADLVASYGTESGGVLSVHFGNVRAIYPGGGVPPFENNTLVRIPVRPVFLAAGDFDTDDRQDLVVASGVDSALHWLTGEWDGSFVQGATTALPGIVTAISAGDVNRRDGLDDVAVGVAGDSSNYLLVFESADGARKATPEVIEFKEPVRDIQTGRLNEHHAIDLVVAAGSEVAIIGGRDRLLGIDRGDAVEVGPPSVRRRMLGSTVTGLAVGDFVGDVRHDLAVATADGSLIIDDLSRRAVFRRPAAISASGRLTPGRFSSLLKDDLAIIDPAGDGIEILTQHHFAAMDRWPAPTEGGAEVATDPAPIRLTSTARPVALETMRLNEDGIDDLVVLERSPTHLAGGGGAQIQVVRSMPMATYVVDEDGDERDTDITDGVCQTINGGCSLHAAAQNANFSPGPDRVTFTINTITPDERSAVFNETVTVDGTTAGRVQIEGSAYSGVRFGQLAVDSSVRGMAVRYISAETAITVEDNYIGVERDGKTPFNGGSLTLGGLNSVVGGSNEAGRNVIRALQLRGAYHQIKGNYFGVDATGLLSVGSSGIIGGSGDSYTFEANVIAGAGTSALECNGGRDWLIQGNLIGLAADGHTALSNGTFGIWLSGSGHTVGGTSLEAGNVIVASNNGIGLLRDSTKVVGNFIGTDASGAVDMGHKSDGIMIWSDARYIQIGGTSSFSGNVIANNGGSGIDAYSPGPIVIQGNYIGTGPGGNGIMGNGRSGIRLDTDSASTVGGSINGRNIIANNSQSGVVVGKSGNVVSYNEIFGNGEAGVLVSRSDAVSNRISRNSIYENGDLGITLGSKYWPLENDSGDADDGPNGRQNKPELALAENRVRAQLNSSPNTNFEIEFFGSRECDPSEYGEGETWLESTTVTTDAAGEAVYEASLAVTPHDTVITATATDPDGNTSEFSNCATVEPTIDELLVRVVSDSLLGAPQPVRNRYVSIGRFDLSAPPHFIDIVAGAETDDEGLLHVGSPHFSPGSEFVILTGLQAVKSSRLNHGSVDNEVYSVWMDNLNVDRQGKLRPDRLSEDPEAVSVTDLNHTTIGFNLIVSIEWKAHFDYVFNLVESLRMASNYLYDVTNGQAFLDKIALYDDARFWHDADVRFFASNFKWPTASVRSMYDRSGAIELPPMMATLDRKKNWQRLTTSVPDPGTPATAKSLIHEFGHFALGLYDEYRGTFRERVHSDINFSFMDEPLQEPMGSEMSRLVTEPFRDTEQYAKHQSPGWDVFASYFSGIHTPSTSGLPDEAIVPGPNQNLGAPSADVGAGLSVLERPPVFVLSPRRFYINTNLSFLTVVLKKKDDGRHIRQGIMRLEQHPTQEEGDLRAAIWLLGAEPGDRLLIGSALRKRWIAKDVVTEETGLSKIQQDTLILDSIEPIAGQFTMLTGMRFDSDGIPIFEIETDHEYATPPEVEVVRATGTVSSTILEQGPSGYTAQLSGLEDEDQILFLAADSLGEGFFVLHDVAIASIDSSTLYVGMPGEGLRFYPDPQEGPRPEQVAILSSDFPPPLEGLPDSVLRISPVYSIHSIPVDGKLKGFAMMYYRADRVFPASDDAITIYRWEDGWQALPTSVDRKIQTATATLDEPGFYAAFLDLTNTTAVAIDEGDYLHESGGGPSVGSGYPNPFGSSLTIPFQVAETAQVTVRLFNVLGQARGLLVDHLYTPGRHILRLDGANLTPGVYIVDFQIGNQHSVVKVLHLH